jgi:adenine-specific DNA-methyltransferase
MATGVARTQRNKDLPTISQPSTPANTDITLSYDGKREERDILHTPPAVTRNIWSGNIDTNGKASNYLCYGDNLPILAAMLRNQGIRRQVRLVYIDPPYATRSIFQSRQQETSYEDLLEGAYYVEFMRERLILLRELLAEDGSIYVHLDKNMAFHIKLVMDEVFGARNFRSLITRRKCNPKNYTRRTYGNVSDYILFYTKSDDYVWHRPVEGWSVERSAKEYQYAEKDGRRYKKVPIHAPGVRNGASGQPWRGVNPPPGKHWQYVPSTLEEMDARGEIYWSPNGNPRRKVYLDDSDGVPVQDIWLDYPDAHNQNIEITGYPTEKNPALLARIIEASSNPGDLVLDCFSGSGTALAAASSLNRRWIGVDSSSPAIIATLRRFTNGLERMGDFVSAKKGVGTGNPAQASLALPLFDDAPSEAKTAPIQAPITDFVLLAEQSSDTQKLEQILQYVPALG